MEKKIWQVRKFDSEISSILQIAYLVDFSSRKDELKFNLQFVTVKYLTSMFQCNISLTCENYEKSPINKHMSYSNNSKSYTIFVLFLVIQQL